MTSPNDNFHSRHSRTTVYQLRANVVSRNGMEEAYSRLIAIVLRFTGKTLKVTLPPEAENHLSFELSDDGMSCECVSVPERLLWAIRFDYPGKENLTWFYDVTMIREEHNLLFGIKIEVSPKTDARPLQSDLSLVKALLDSNLLVQTKPIADNFWPVRNAEEVDQLIALLTDANRTLPVIVVSELNRASRFQRNYMLDAAYLAKQVKGFAIVVRLAFKATFPLVERVGKSWAVYDGSTRTYYPKVDFENGIPVHHPFNLREKIRYWIYGNERGPEAHANFLVNVAYQAASRNRTDWSGLYFVPDARILAAEIEMAHALHEANAPEREQAMKKHIEALQKKLLSAEADNVDWLEEAEKASEIAEYYKQQNADLRMRLDAMRAHLHQQNDEMPDKDVPIPDKYDEMETWVRTYLAGQLILHPRAERAVSKAVYEDVRLVYKALLALANEYRDSRMGVGTDEAFKAALAGLGVEFAGAIDKARAGQEGEAYYVNYPIGSTSRAFLEYHLSKGTRHEDRYCLRIYFFWDDSTKQVVVGWLPSHLNNRIS